jgi:hypothetical protein
MARQEFTRSVKAEIMLRTKRETGFQCEHPGCGLIVSKGEIHHLEMDAMKTDKRRKLTADDGAFWCEPCHDAETAKQAPILAKVKRIEAKHLRAVVPKAKIAAPPKREPEHKSPVNGVSEIMRRMGLS